MVDIFVGYLTRHLQHRYDTQLAGFLTGLAYPHIAVAVFLYVAPLKRFYIAECKAGEAAEHECVPGKFQTRHHGEVEFENLHNLSLSQKLAFRLSTVELSADERVFSYPLMRDGILDSVLEIAEVLHSRVVGAVLADTKEMLEIIYHSCRDIPDWNIIYIHSQTHELAEVGHATLPTQVSCIDHVATFHFLFSFGIGFSENLTWHFRLLNLAEK